MAEVVLPRIRVRRRRPPSGREIYARLWLLAILYQFGCDFYRMLTDGSVSTLIVLAVLIWMYTFWRKMLRVWVYLESIGYGRPVQWDEWFCLALQMFVVAITTGLTFG